MTSPITGIAAGLALADAAAHNIANVSTPGARRERVELQPVEPRAGVAVAVTHEAPPAEVPPVEIPAQGLHGHDLLTELVSLVIAHAQLGINVESLKAGLDARRSLVDRSA